MRQFVVATGSNLAIEEVRNKASRYFFIVSTPQGCADAPGLVRQIVCYANAYVNPRPDAEHYDIYPPPGEGLPIVWDVAHPEWISYGYKFTEEWATEFASHVAQFILKNSPAGILLDDWMPDHSWWRCEPAIYNAIHALPHELRVVVMSAIESQLRAMAALRKTRIFTNGPPLSAGSRYWEGVGQSWRPHEMVEREYVAGDILYNNTGDEVSWTRTRNLAITLDADYAIGFPDGQPLLDDAGKWRIPMWDLPEDEND